MKKLFSAILVAVLLAASCASAEDYNSLFGGLTSIFGIGEETIYDLGETAELDGASATLVNVMESKGGSENAPDDGNVFVICEFEIENISSESLQVSTLMCFSMFCDNTSYSLSLEALAAAMSGGKFQADMYLEPGEKKSGVVGYEVPADWKELKITYTPELWGVSRATFGVTR